MERAVKVLVLALLYVLAVCIVELVGFYHPFFWTYSAVFAAVLAAWPYFKLCQSHPILVYLSLILKVPEVGVTILQGVVAFRDE